MSYRLENRYQDSSWDVLEECECYMSIDFAVQIASNYSVRESIAYGMVRVVDNETDEIIVTFPAGRPV